MNKREKQKVEKAMSAALAKTTGVAISDCNFVGVQYDAQAVSAIETIASGLVENAKALHALAEVLRASSVHIDTMVKVDYPPLKETKQ